MAKNLLQKLGPEDSFHVFDVSEHTTSSVASVVTQTPVTIASSAGEVGKKADVVITMLPGPAHVESVYSEIVKGFDKASASHKVFIDSSTVDMATSLKVSETLHDLGSFFFDAPVSGGVVGAANGSLTFMIGGGSVDNPTSNEGPSQLQIDVYRKTVAPTLAKMGTNLVPCGGPGLGLAAKLANNYLLALTNIACSESFQLAKSLGLSLPLYSKIVSSSSGRCWSSDVNNPVPDILASAPSSRNYENGFGIPLMKKDLGLAMHAAEQAKLPLLLADKAFEIYTDVENDGFCKDKDISVIYQYIEEMKGDK